MKEFVITFLVLLFIICFALRLDAQQSNNNTPISERLNPDGSLKTDDGFTGSLDPTGYKMTYDAQTNAPKFFSKGNPPKAQVITWSALGSGVDGGVYAIAVSGSDVYVGGSFTSAGGVMIINIAKWNGSSWSELGNGTDAPVCAIAVSGSDVYVGGYFSSADGVPANYIAKWDGSSWSALGSGVSNSVLAIAVSGSDVYAGGYFTWAGGSSASRIAKWNGSSWSALGSGVDNAVYALAVTGSDVYAGGSFSNAGGSSASRIAKWNLNSSSWSALGGGTLDAVVYAIAVSGSDVYVGGEFTQAGGSPGDRIAKWNGSSWSSLGSGMNNTVYAIAAYGSDVYVGGTFTEAGGITASKIAKWNGSAWSALGSGTNSTVRALAVNTSEGKMMIGGDFTTVDGSISANYVARFVDSQNPLPIELTSFNATLHGKTVSLRWQTATEVDNYGFNIERKVSSSKSDWQTIGFVAGNGTSNTPHAYSFSDHSSTQSGKYAYRLKQMDRDGSHSYSNVVEVHVGIPSTMTLDQNYPNPFSQSTKINFTLPSSMKISLKVFDVLGREVQVLDQGMKEAGSYSIRFGKNESEKTMTLAKGVYYYTLSTGEQNITRKMMLME